MFINIHYFALPTLCIGVYKWTELSIRREKEEKVGLNDSFMIYQS